MRTAITRLTRTQKSTAVGLAAVAGVAALSAGASPASAAGGEASHSPAKKTVGHSVSADAGTKTAQATTGNHAKDIKADHPLTQSLSKGEKPAGDAKNAKDTKDAKADKQATAAKNAKAEQASKAKEARADADASRSTDRTTKSDNLDGWIKEARVIMKEEGIPGSYQGIKKNIMRESAGDPNAMNDWDINAKKGTPSKGLLQTIQPTFDAYHVEGTTDKVTDPVANIVAACNYAADKYGSMDNVDSAY
ncbi:MAG: transglycosylase SLT domain-containing protein [Streptomyces sp.]|uniref:transglycosylase SLT domain-containing protein n=1 Tax=Streptomyces sp. TaxID=1931 RepID=UPI003D6A9B20